jgi:uncharacterized protein (DUF2141 family)
MKKVLFILPMLVFSMVLSSYSGDQAQGHVLVVKVAHLRNSKGNVQFALYNRDGSIPDEHYKKYYRIEKAKIIDGTSEVVFKNLPGGRYAVNVLHDENSNGKIDKGLLLPKEGIGFSNYQSIGITNKPNFSKASFELNDDREMTVKVVYL